MVLVQGRKVYTYLNLDRVRWNVNMNIYHIKSKHSCKKIDLVNMSNMCRDSRVDKYESGIYNFNYKLLAVRIPFMHSWCIYTWTKISIYSY